MTELLSTISVFFFFLTFLLNSIQKDVTSILSEKNPEKKQTTKIKEFREKLQKVFFLKSLPITLVFVITFYILLPNTLKIFQTSKIDFWDFDEIKAFFVLTEIGILGLTIYSLIKTIMLLVRLIKVNQQLRRIAAEYVGSSLVVVFRV